MNEKLNNVEWSFTQETGCLTITGTGKMQNWAEHQERPWEEIRDEIRWEWRAWEIVLFRIVLH